MEQTIAIRNDAPLSCHVCLREVPVSEALCPEAVDYVLHYFGLDCFCAWERQARAPEERKRQE